MKRSRTLVLFAVLLALLFHLLFAEVFRIVPPEELPVSQKPGPETVMISRHETAQAWENTLFAFSQIKDPTLMTLPDYDRGFSRIQTEPLSTPYQPIPGYTATIRLAEETDQDEFFLPVASVDMAGELATHWSVLDVTVARLPQTAVPAAIVWRTPAGRILEHMPSLPVAEVRRALDIKPATGLSRVEIVRKRDLARVRLIESSGNARLDQFVVSEIGKRVSRLEALQEPYRSPHARDIFPEPGGRAIIEVEWRFIQPGSL